MNPFDFHNVMHFEWTTQYLVEIKMHNHILIFSPLGICVFVLTTFNMDTQMVIDLS